MPPKKGVKQSAESKSVARIRWTWRIGAAEAYADDRPFEVELLMSTMVDHVSSLCFQLESAPTTGYLHYQGFFELTVKKRKNWILEHILPFNFLAPSKGTPTQNFAYCSKAETCILGPWKIGEPSIDGQRTDIVDFRNAIMEGKSDKELWEAFPNSMCRYRNMPADIRSINPPERKSFLEVYLFYGPPGTGKTEYARKLAIDNGYVPYEPPLGKDFWLTKWMYGKEFIILDEFKSNMSLKDLLKLLDQIPIEVPIKNGFMWWCPKYIIITTNVSPWNWYQYKDRDFEREALFRRIYETYFFQKNDDREPRPEEADISDKASFERLVPQRQDSPPRGQKRNYPIFEEAANREYKQAKLELMKKQIAFFSHIEIQ
jgi:hypothetical protein